MIGVAGCGKIIKAAAGAADNAAVAGRVADDGAEAAASSGALAPDESLHGPRQADEAANDQAGSSILGKAGETIRDEVLQNAVESELGRSQSNEDKRE